MDFVVALFIAVQQNVRTARQLAVVYVVAVVHLAHQALHQQLVPMLTQIAQHGPLMVFALALFIHPRKNVNIVHQHVVCVAHVLLQALPQLLPLVQLLLLGLLPLLPLVLQLQQQLVLQQQRHHSQRKI
uniref:Uncharacterized protein n=1 Tax=Acrobeloides nanus TaxID=290746 RepID=A0A914ENT2_9BILA